MYAHNYARYRASAGDGDAPLPTTMGGGGGLPGGQHPSMMMQPAQAGRPRGVPGRAPAMYGGGGEGYDPAMAMPLDMAPEDLAKSVQPVGGRYMARRMNPLPRGRIGSRGGGGGRDQWSPSADYAPNSMDGGYGGNYAPVMPSMSAPRPMGRQPPPGGDSYVPPTKYRRTSDFDDFEDPRNSMGRRPGGGVTGGDRGGGGGVDGGPHSQSSSNYRVPANSYDLTTRDNAVKTSRGGGGPSAVYAPPSQQQPQQQQQQPLRPPPQRAGYAQYAPPSPNTPRTQQEMMLMRRRLMDQGQERDRFTAVDPMPMGYRGGPPSSSIGLSPSGGAPPPTMSSAAAAWARELDPYDNARRIHRELQPPSATGGGGGGTGGGGSVNPQAAAQMRLHRSTSSGYENSPGSRIVTPAAALHSAQRRSNPMAPPQLQSQSPSPLPPFEYAEFDPMAMGMAMPRVRIPRGMGTQGTQGTQGSFAERSLPPAAVSQFSMQEYEAMMLMERELATPPMHEPRRQPSGHSIGGRPPSAGAGSRGRGRGGGGGAGITPARGSMPTPPAMMENVTKFEPPQPYMIQQENPYAMAAGGAISLPPGPSIAAPSQARLSKAAREAATQSQAPRAASKKRKEPPASKRKARITPDDFSTLGSEVKEKIKPLSKSSNSHHKTTGGGGEPKRRCGRKSMNYSSEQKRERNRAAVKKCRQRQALKYDYLKRKAEVLASENRALSEMLVKNVELDDEKRNSLTRGIQMDILLKIKEIFTQSLPKDFVLDADSIWDLNSVLAVSMPSRCYYGIESIKDFWRTSLRMRNKGKIRSFWAWLFRLPPGDRFAEFTITPFSPTSNLYFIHWTTNSTPALSGSIVIMFGHGHRVTLHVEIFGWLIWRYLLTNTPFPEPLE